MGTALSVKMLDSRVMPNLLRCWFATGLVLLLIGLASRLVPLLVGGDLLFRQFMTEDGYLMLTVARNIALGKGMTIADGTISTNGVQPLVTFLYAACFWLAGGDRATGLIYVHILSVLVSAGSAILILLLARSVISGSARGWSGGALAAGLWFSAPLIVQHSMNGLETGLYFLVIGVVANLLVRWAGSSAEGWSFPRLAGIGLLFGVAFWIRNDAVFLVSAFCLVWLLRAPTFKGVDIRRRGTEVFVIGLTSLAIASPWLIYNHTLFGSIVPISGISESLGADFAQHAYLLPVKLAEHITLLFPVPMAMETSFLVRIGCLIVVGAFLYGITTAYKAGGLSNRIVILTFVLFGLALTGYYGFLFGATHFLSRYLAPLTVFTAVGAAAGLLVLSREMDRRGWRAAVPVLAGVMVLLASGLNFRLFLLGNQHEHFQVVQWVQKHVEEQQWVGAVQTGTLGFFHDRTINLDGKVNPYALKARKKDAVLDYVVESDIEYIVDWAGITAWVDLDPLKFGRHFEVVVRDSENNLGVLRRVRSDE